MLCVVQLGLVNSAQWACATNKCITSYNFVFSLECIHYEIMMKWLVNV